MNAQLIGTLIAKMVAMHCDQVYYFQPPTTTSAVSSALSGTVTEGRTGLAIFQGSSCPCESGTPNENLRCLEDWTARIKNSVTCKEIRDQIQKELRK